MLECRLLVCFTLERHGGRFHISLTVGAAGDVTVATVRPCSVPLFCLENGDAVPARCLYGMKMSDKMRMFCSKRGMERNFAKKSRKFLVSFSER